MANKARELCLQMKMVNHEGVRLAKPTPDLRACDQQKFASSSLATFNKKKCDTIKGKVGIAESEVDDLPPPAFAKNDESLEDSDDITSNGH